jgi:hypothetical protein
VVDCGGGTVDLVSYEVTSIAPMVVKECVKGPGCVNYILMFGYDYPSETVR